MRALLWAWIIGFTALVLYMPPMLEKLPTRQGETVRWRNKGAFEQSVLQSSIHETRVDISRLIVSLLAINFLPAVALWRYNEIREWLQRHKSEIDTTFVRLAVFAVSMMVIAVLIGLVLLAQRSSSGGAKVGSPSPAKDPSKTLPAALDHASQRVEDRPTRGGIPIRTHEATTTH